MTGKAVAMTRRTLQALAIQITVLIATLTLALDMYAHKRVEAFGGVNYWGYKGGIASGKRPQETRIAIVGGTRAFGWGVPASALVSELRRVIMLTTDRRGEELRPIVVINLGRPGALAMTYPRTIEHFAYLQPDYICLYDDLGVRGAEPADGRSGVFALTGYAPALPLVLREKGAVWRHGDLRRAYGESKKGYAPFFRRAAGTTLEWSGAALEAVDRALADALPSSRYGDATAGPAQGYADAMVTAIDAAHRYARGVVVAVGPADTDEQARNLRDLRLRLDRDEVRRAWLRFVDLDRVPDLHDSSLRLDGWNLGSAGTALVANTIAPALLGFIEVAR